MASRALHTAREHVAELLFAVAVALLLLLRTYALHFVRADEHVYNYMSLLVLEGRWPYRDFFLSHPPAHVYLMAAVFAVTGYSLALSKWVATLAAAIAAGFVLGIGKRLFGKPEGLCAALLVLITPQVLDGSADVTGANVTMVLLTGGAYFALRARHRLAGGLLALASLSGLYAVPLALMLAVLSWFRSRRAALELAGAYAVILVLLSLPFVIVAGERFVYQVVTYNLLKQPHRTSWLEAFSTFFFFNHLPMLGFVSALALSGLRWVVEGRPTGDGSPVARSAGRWQRLRRAVDPWRPDYVGATFLLGTWVFGYFAFYATLQVFYSYYFVMIVPPMALLTAYAAVDVARYGWRVLVAGETASAESAATSRRSGRARQRPPQRRRVREARSRRGPRLGPRLVALFALVATVVHHGRVRDWRLEQAKTDQLRFAWHDSPWLGHTLNRWVERLFWEPERDRRDPPNPITRYLQDESQFAHTADDFVAAVRRHCRPGDRIFGDYYLAPYAAAVSDCRVAADLVDTNTHRIRAGESTLEQWLAAAEADGLSLVVMRSPGWMARQPAIRQGLLERFPTVVFTWRDPHVGRVELRRPATTAR